MTQPTRDPRSFVTARPGALGHPGYSRDAALYIRCMQWLHDCVEAEANELGLTITDHVNNLLVERYRGVITPPTPEQLAEEKVLTPEEAVSHLDPTLRGNQSRDELIHHFEGIAAQEALTLDRLEEEEDKAVEVVYQEQLDLAKQRATSGGSTDPYGPRTEGTINHKRYAEEIELAKQRKAREDKARVKRREQRRYLLCVAAQMIGPLRKAGDPRTHRQYEQPSSWATMGGYSRRDLAEADRRTPKDTS